MAHKAPWTIVRPSDHQKAVDLALEMALAGGVDGLGAAFWAVHPTFGYESVLACVLARSNPGAIGQAEAMRSIVLKGLSLATPEAYRGLFQQDWMRGYLLWDAMSPPSTLMARTPEKVEWTLGVLCTLMMAVLDKEIPGRLLVVSRFTSPSTRMAKVILAWGSTHWDATRALGFLDRKFRVSTKGEHIVDRDAEADIARICKIAALFNRPENEGLSVIVVH